MALMVLLGEERDGNWCVKSLVFFYYFSFKLRFVRNDIYRSYELLL